MKAKEWEGEKRKRERESEMKECGRGTGRTMNTR